jgi:phasin family protein
MVEKKAAKPVARTPEPKVPVAAPDAPEAAVAPAVAPAAAPAAVAKPAPAAVKAAGSTAFPALPGFLKDYDFSKLFRELKVPALPDMEAVLATHKRNLEALSDANRVALEGAQAVARRHLEIVQSTMTEMTDSMKSLSVTEAPASRAAKQAELLKHAYENAVSNTRELGDLIQRSNTEALQKLNHRFSEAMNELKTLFNKL